MSDFVSLALTIALPLTLIGLIATCARLFLGPSRADRVVSLDLLTVLLAATAALAALRFDNPAYLDISLTLALIGFLATVAFARYVESEPARARPVPPDGSTAVAGAPDDAVAPASDPRTETPTIPTATRPEPVPSAARADRGHGTDTGRGT